MRARFDPIRVSKIETGWLIEVEQDVHHDTVAIKKYAAKTLGELKERLHDVARMQIERIIGEFIPVPVDDLDEAVRKAVQGAYTPGPRQAVSVYDACPKPDAKHNGWLSGSSDVGMIGV